MRKILIIIILILCVLTPVFADELYWKQFSNYVYLNTDSIKYYIDDIGDEHAAVIQKHLRDKNDEADKFVDNLCLTKFKKHLGYTQVINDINLTKKTNTLCYIIYFDKKGKQICSIEMGRKEDCSEIPPLTVEEEIYYYLIKNKKIN